VNVRKSSSRLARLLLAAATIFPAGCAGLPPPVPPQVVSDEARRWIETLERRWAQFEDLKAQVQITIRRGDRAQRLVGVLLLRSPASVRFEALTPWGQPFLLLATTGESFTLWEVAENRAVIGPAGAEATARWLGLALSPDELVGILAGHLLPLRDFHSAELLDPDALGPSLRLTGPGGIQRLWLDPETAVPRQVELLGGRTPARIAYVGGGATEPPTGLTLTALDRPLSVSVRYQHSALGTGLSSDLFTLTVPEHTTVQRFR
jgi:outer membrane lipoprotein-sorting protein